MTDDNDEPSMPLPSRGTGSAGNPVLGGETTNHEDEPTITINDPNTGAVRVYRLTERVKSRYEGMVDQIMQGRDVDWYEHWWEGTELVVEWKGRLRGEKHRPEMTQQEMMEELQDMPEEQQADAMEEMQDKTKGIPAEPRPPFMPREGVLQVGVQTDGQEQDPFGEFGEGGPDYDDEEYLDDGVLPMHDFTRFDIQERADRRPLQVEDVIIEPWKDWGEDEPPEPVSVELPDGVDQTDSGDVYTIPEEDLREGTDTVKEGGRGDRYHL